MIRKQIAGAFLAGLLPVALAPASVLAGDVTVCKKDGDERTLEVVTPGQVGAACDLKYVRGGGSNVSTPYHANNDANFCYGKITEFVENLSADGFVCTIRAASADVADVVTPGPAPVATPTTGPVSETVADSVAEPAVAPVAEATPPSQAATVSPSASETADGRPPFEFKEDYPDLAAAQQPQPTAPAVSSAQPQAPVSDPVSDVVTNTVRPAPAEPKIIPAPIVETAPLPASTIEPVVSAAPQPADIQPAAQTPAGASVVSRPPVVEATTNNPATDTPAADKIENPASNAPIDKPVQLTSLDQPSPAPASGGGSSKGRLVGAPPDREDVEAVAAEKIVPITPAAAKPRAPEADPIATAPVSPSPQGTAGSVTDQTGQDKTVRGNAKLRPSEDIIKSVLMAQTAAWNEGNLEAFMGGYWRSPDLRMVSGSEVTKGWRQVMKRYKSRYGDNRSLGRLVFDDMSVELVTEDVAVVIGRYGLNQQGVLSSGSFSLVLKRFDGLWRIVHDHTTADPAKTVTAAAQ